MGFVKQTRAAAPGWEAWALRACALVVIVACAAAWVAVDRAHRAAVADRRAASAALSSTIDLATATAGLAAQLHSSLDALTAGTRSTGEAISHAVTISENLRSLVSVVADGSVTPAEAKQLTTVTDTLGDLEASLLETAGGVDETLQALTTAQPLVAAATATLQALPDHLRATSRDQMGGTGQGWWRVAIVLAGLVLLTIVAALSALVRRPDQP